MTTEERYRTALEELAINPETRERYYSLRYMRHDDSCCRGGDQACPCGEASTWWNLDTELDAAEAAWHVLRGATLDEAYKLVANRLHPPSAIQTTDGQ